ncbi:hypothetical protein, conserved [Eimeria maxima]|uniref:Uncharacterized protein n=1 Tax=Eimeria maxima TaxID=5804 RepID=U6MCM2_EIMMA|nr:hypothetical protein, conserved [Eimeria maxima]CDJ59415.1 hypothetical protein, conserved [Eimeria maxima]
MQRCSTKTRLNPLWAAALLVSAATTTGALRAPVGGWGVQQQRKEPNLAAVTDLGAYPKYKGGRIANELNFISSLQVASASAQHAEEDEPSEGSAAETAASHGEKERHTEKESHMEGEGTEEEKHEEAGQHVSGGSQLSSAKEPRTATGAPFHAVGETETITGTSSEKEKEEGLHPAGKESAAEPSAAPEGAPAEGSAVEAERAAMPVHQHKVAAAKPGDIAAEGAIHKPEHTGESRKTTDGAAGSAPVPQADKFVMQMNFRPSLVIGRAEADRTERHVIRDNEGAPWFEVTGPQSLTVLNLKPVQGEELLHSLVATTMQS